MIERRDAEVGFYLCQKCVDRKSNGRGTAVVLLLHIRLLQHLHIRFAELVISLPAMHIDCRSPGEPPSDSCTHETATALYIADCARHRSQGLNTLNKLQQAQVQRRLSAPWRCHSHIAKDATSNAHRHTHKILDLCQ